jgi:hypothetical protein
VSPQTLRLAALSLDAASELIKARERIAVLETALHQREHEYRILSDHAEALEAALKSAGACFARIFADTATAGYDSGIPHVADYARGEAFAIIAVLAAPAKEKP